MSDFVADVSLTGSFFADFVDFVDFEDVADAADVAIACGAVVSVRVKAERRRARERGKAASFFKRVMMLSFQIWNIMIGSVDFVTRLGGET